MNDKNAVSQNMAQCFCTTNRQLAFALAVAGCQFAPQTPEMGGPAQNLYTLGFLRDRKIGKGMGIEAAVKIAVQREIPGIVTYIFIRDGVFEVAMKAWDDMHKNWVEAHQLKQEPIMPDISPQDVMRVLFCYFNQLEELAKVPWFNTPLVSDIDPSIENRVDPDGKKADVTVISGKGRVWSLGASEATKRHLKLI